MKESQRTRGHEEKKVMLRERRRTGVEKVRKSEKDVKRERGTEDEEEYL